MTQRDTIVIGASSGGVAALSKLCALLPGDLPASILVVLHIGARSSHLPKILESSGPLPARHAKDGEAARPGHIYVAPPDYHMLLEDNTIRLSRGPKENHTRPAIDPLFRSAALSRGRRVVGIVLSGYLDDGTAGLHAIKRCGGVAMVQDPAEAQADSMPLSALQNVAVDHCLGVDQLARKLADMAGEPVEQGISRRPEELVKEHLSSTGEGNMTEKLQDIAEASTIVCPECKGVLWELHDKAPVRFRCHTGHAYTLRSLAHEQVATAEAALWGAVRALQDLEEVMRKLAAVNLSKGDSTLARTAGRAADKAGQQARTVEQLIEGESGAMPEQDEQGHIPF
ncbi:chemotaxis protein CheB [Polaromonas aquatica]|uniref:chemotaxis protein CheB n=1 Tax=Polaromonas aquatica TaxID=332657 RepID=UPI003D648E7C